MTVSLAGVTDKFRQPRLTNCVICHFEACPKPGAIQVTPLKTIAVRCAKSRYLAGSQ